jgi:hypothetical protein
LQLQCPRVSKGIKEEKWPENLFLSIFARWVLVEALERSAHAGLLARIAVVKAAQEELWGEESSKLPGKCNRKP